MDHLVRRKATLIVANGERPPDSLLSFHRDVATTLIALDGAAVWLEQKGISPDIVIGDFDSADFSQWQHLTCHRIDDQNNNDLEKALRYCLANGLKEITVLGAFGLRVDHFLTNLAVLRKFANALEITFTDALQSMFMCPQGRAVDFLHRARSFISLFPLGDTVGPIWTDGVAYPLHGEYLSLRDRLGTLNCINSEHARLTCASPDLVVVIENKFAG